MVNGRLKSLFIQHHDAVIFYNPGNLFDLCVFAENYIKTFNIMLNYFQIKLLKNTQNTFNIIKYKCSHREQQEGKRVRSKVKFIP